MCSQSLDVKHYGRHDNMTGKTRSGSVAADIPAADDGIAMGLLPELVGYHVRQAQMAIFADFDAALGELGVSPGIFGLLVIIAANPGLKQTRIADAVRLDRSTLVPALDKLEQRGLVERRAAPGDRRSNGIFLTADGTDLLNAERRAVRRHETRLARDFAPGERANLIALLARIFPEHR